MAILIGADGSLQDSNTYRASVCHHARQADNSVAVWLEGNGPLPKGTDGVNHPIATGNRTLVKTWFCRRFDE